MTWATALVILAVAVVLTFARPPARRCPECGSSSLCDDDCTAPQGRYR